MLHNGHWVDLAKSTHSKKWHDIVWQLVRRPIAKKSRVGFISTPMQDQRLSRVQEILPTNVALTYFIVVKCILRPWFHHFVYVRMFPSLNSIQTQPYNQLVQRTPLKQIEVDFNTCIILGWYQMIQIIRKSNIF